MGVTLLLTLAMVRLRLLRQSATVGIVLSPLQFRDTLKIPTLVLKHRTVATSALVNQLQDANPATQKRDPLPTVFCSIGKLAGGLTVPSIGAVNEREQLTPAGYVIGAVSNTAVAAEYGILGQQKQAKPRR